eukprot:TRINITY_DN21313_c0_g3_i1.p1 TRINITY_DN21313_c0_g3~~TRINITY_DN21313_c0_g3_i1.p1  ORF type:complete len:307 (+),score=55.00 TRINITY_DN21313_c0_g3_i1:47-967(+)
MNLLLQLTTATVLIIQYARAGYLDEARKLKSPVPKLVSGGEDEDSAFWEVNEELLSNAWKEYPKKHSNLYTIEGIESHLNKDIISKWNAKDEDAIWKHIIQSTGIDGVYKIRLFEDSFGEELISELNHLRDSGIPIRRPNGMNRFGVILEDVGLGKGIRHVVQKYLSPLAQMVFTEFIVGSDVEDQFSFTIRYKDGEDVSLAPHTDASSFTVNLCLGLSFEGGDVTFYGDGSPKTVTSVPGVALLHRGMLRHSASPLTSGERHNLVIWVFGKDGYVRVAPYPPEQQSTHLSRWQHFDAPQYQSQEL